ncbi:MAG: hypothetical protein HYX33_03150 [Actinobacteria bacterium]|nr:hypothetical protein [Actinomycetota bacterium]
MTTTAARPLFAAPNVVELAGEFLLSAGGPDAGAALRAIHAHSSVVQVGRGASDALSILGTLLSGAVARDAATEPERARSVAIGIAAFAEWRAARGVVSADEATDLAVTARHAAAETASLAAGADALEDALAAASTERILATTDLGALGGRVARIAPGRVWIVGPFGEEIGPVRVPPRASAAMRPGWRLSSAVLGRAPIGWVILEMGPLLPEWADDRAGLGRLPQG